MSEDAVNKLVNDYMENVAENGATCCHHTCGNPLLDDFVQGNMGAAGVSQQVIDAYKAKMYDATMRSEFKVQQPEDDSHRVEHDSLNSVQRAMAAGSGSSNQTMVSESGGAGTDYDTPVQDSGTTTQNNYVEGYEMTQESVTPVESSSFSFTGSDILASIFVVGTIGVIYFGFWRRKKF
jgi:cobaltochelatase CobN